MHNDNRNNMSGQGRNPKRAGSYRAVKTPAQANRRPAQNTRPVNNGQSGSRQNGSSTSDRRLTPRREINRTPVSGHTRANHPVAAAQAPVPVSNTKKAVAWLKKTFAVDEAVIEKRDIVREKGSVDYIFLITVLVLLAFGTVMVYSASYAYAKNMYDDSYYIIFRHFLFLTVGFVAMTAAMFVPPEVYKKFAVWGYAGCFVALCLVPIIGESHGGAKRWIDIGITEIQPSEFMKLGLVLCLAWYFDRYYERIIDTSNMTRASFFGAFTPLVITGATCFLVIIEKHLSGTIIMALIGVIIIFASGAPLRVLGALGAVGGVGLVIFSLVTDYTRRRIEIWFHPENDPLNAGYQTLQGLYAIGSGGIFGTGLGNSTQKHMFVSQPQNDFIFTIICEELGFIGALGVIILFGLFVWRGIIIAMKSPDVFTTLLVIGIVGKVAIQSLFNVAVVTNSIPNTGISLPFFSYGGSSLIVLMLEMGIVLSVSRYSKQQR